MHADSPGYPVDKASDGKVVRPPKAGGGSWLSWFLGKLVRLKGPIAAVAAVGAVLSGMVGYWNTYRTVRSGVTPVVATNTLPAEAGPLSILVLPTSPAIPRKAMWPRA
jgi:hypothetical protein